MIQTPSILMSSGRKKYKAELCIYTVPEKLRKVKEDAYSPRVVAIGPFHRDNGNLAPMSQHKLFYMASFLMRYTGEDNATGALTCLRKCIEVIHRLHEVIRLCYIDRIHRKDNDELIEMMLIDGCFMLELFLRNHLKSDNMLKKEYESDPVLESHWTMTALKHDLALLENQIPFVILEILYDIVGPIVRERCEAPESVTSLALTFFTSMSQKEIKEEEASKTECKHLLDLLHKRSFVPDFGIGVFLTNVNDVESIAKKQNQCRVDDGRKICKQAAGDSSSNISVNFSAVNQYSGFKFCASELVQSRVEFSKQSSDFLANITFMEGLIELPPVYIDKDRDALLRNLIAYEQSSTSNTQHITSYAILMRTLIRSQRDVKVLRKKGIITQDWIADDEFLTQFNNLLDEVLPKEFHFGHLCDQVDAYAHKFRFRRTVNSVYRTYFSTAWSMVSFIAAIGLFVLTVIQTYFAIYPR